MISSELEELVRNCDRIVVIREGENIAELCGEDIHEETIIQKIAEHHNTGEGINWHEKWKSVSEKQWKLSAKVWRYIVFLHNADRNNFV